MSSKRSESKRLRVAREPRDELLCLIVNRIGDLAPVNISNEEFRQRTGLDLRGFDLWLLREHDPEGRFLFSRLMLIAETLGIKLELRMSKGELPATLRTAPARYSRGQRSKYAA